MAGQGYFISDLPRVQTPSVDMAGGLMEWELPIGPGGGLVNVALTYEQLKSLLGGALPPNQAPSLLKAFRLLTRTEIAANGGFGESFEDLDYATCCVQTKVLIEFYQPDPAKPRTTNQVLVAVFDPSATPKGYVYVDGSFKPGELIPAKFVPVDSDEARYGYVRRDTSPASINDWALGELSIWNINGADQFATAKQVGGPFPAFTGVEDDYWKPAAAPSMGSTPGGTGGALFTDDIPVSQSGGRTFGKYQNGQVIPAKGKTANEVILLAAIDTIFPAYATANASLVQSAPQDGEVGESVANTLTLTFNQGDAGALTSDQINKDGVRISTAGTTSPFSRNSNVVRTLTPIVYQGLVSYAAGTAKNITPGNTPDTRTPGVRNPNAPQAAESNLGSNTVAIIGYYLVFFGPASGPPTTSAAIRALPSQLTTAGNQGTLNTGTTAKDFIIAPPPGQRLLSVFDLDNQGANITAAYVKQADLAVADAGGTTQARPIYLYRAAGPYPANARHQFTYGQ